MNIALDLFLIVSFVIATLLNMLSPLKFTYDLSMTFIISGIIAVIFYFLLYYKQKKLLRILLIVYILLLIVSFPLLKEGFSITINTIIKAYNAHSQFGFPSLAIPFGKQPALACNYFLLITSIPFIILSVETVQKAKHFIPPFLISLLYIGIPLLFNIEAQRTLLFFYLASLVSLLMSIKVRKQNQSAAKPFPLIVFALVIGLLFGIQTYYPENDYQRNEWAENIRKNLSKEGINLIFDLFSKRDTNRSNLLSAGNRYYTGKVDLTVQSDEPVTTLLKGTSFMKYQNNEWSNPELTVDYREHEMTATSTMEDLLTEVYPTFDYTNRTMVIENTSSLDNFMYMPYFISRQSGLYNLDSKAKGFYFTPNASTYLIQYMDVPLEILSTPIPRLDEEYRYIRSHYLQIPDHTRSVLLDYLDNQISPFDSTDIIVDQVVNIIKNSADYTLSPGLTPKDRDFVDYFLNVNKRGYCVHFATTATMMLRALDIPARYVEGYSLNSQDFTDGTALVRDNQAHAWVEVYFQNFGWIPFDVTPSATYAPIENEEEEITGPLEENNASSQQNQNNQNQTNIGDINDEVNAKVSSAPLYLLIVIPVILLAYGLYRWWLYRDCHSSDAKQNILRYYKRLLRLTPKVEEEIYQLVLKVRFSPHPITAQETLKMESYYHQKVSEIKKGSSLIKKVWITLLY
mgnify:FL=1